jgi:Fe2+ transport system protein FeoA
MNLHLWLSLGLVAALVVGVSYTITITRPRSTAARRDHEEDGTAALLAAGLLPLVDCPRDRQACLRCVQIDHCVVRRLRELGLTPGVEVRIVQDAGGPMLVSVRGSRVALGRDLAAKMWVELSAPDTDLLSA